MIVRVLDEGAALVTVTAATGHELAGELPCWEQPIEMQRAGAVWQAQLRVAPGVYQMKLRAANGAWSIDPAWRTWGENGVLVVGGTAEPVLHAPSAPWVVVHADGRVTLRAALRRGAGDRLSLRIDGETTRMRAIGGDATHLWFERDLAGAGKTLEYAFVLGDGRVIDGASIALRDFAAPLPAWWRDAVVYSIFVDRFRRTDGWRDPVAWSRDTHAGGTLDGIVDALPYLADLGVTALHLTPICESHSPHRYDAVDPIAIAGELGGEAAFARLLEAAHARSLRVIVDVAATHVHRDFAPFADVRARGPASPYWRWFRTQHWPFFDGYEPGYAHYQKGQWQEPLLAVDEPEVQDAIVEWFATWAKRGADGLRVDAAADLSRPLLAKIRAAVRSANPSAIVFGEVVPQCLDRFTPSVLDAATDFAYREALVGWVRDGSPLTGVASAQRFRGAASAHAIGFTSTHDQPRIGTVTQDPSLARLGLAIALLGARVPMIYYGDEVGLAADPSAAKREFEDAWPDRQPMPWNESDWDLETRAMVRALLALRREHALLRHGDEEVIALDDDTLLIRRRSRDQAIDIVIHRGTRDHAIELPCGPARVLFPDSGGDGMVVGPRSVTVFDRREIADDVHRELRANNARLAVEAFTAGHVECPAYPSRLYLTVTEACNLRCAHCITDAPAKTQAGTARTIQPWLLDALEDSFAHADYVAFTHGGESVTAPIFPEVLRRIRRARGGRPIDVHVVSNGMLLDEARLTELVELGVTSLMISLDGATPRTNDRIRVLGKLDRVVANLAAAVKLRERGLRVGVSTVVGATNVAELPALGRLCVSLGVDWLKIEETYPATPFARRDLLAPQSAGVVAAMAALRDAIAGHAITLVDHLDPPAACTCSGDPAVIAFRAADDFANRATFRPCRTAWEQAAIDPDGVVHVGDYAGAPLGSLLDAPMLALWNAAPALAARTAAQRGFQNGSPPKCA
jgi:glycosidase/MoaA/NifB/PqqE/SkfB family radical SAM enzyme